MFEAYAFLAMFTIQILALSVLYPTWFIRYSRQQATSIPAKRLAQLYPGVDIGLARSRFLARYRALSTGIAMLGLLLLGWLFSYMQRPEWHVSPVEALVAAYCMVQMLLPLGMVAWHGVRFKKMRRHSLQQRKRKASLQPRGLFDFVAPCMVFLAALSYFLFAASVIYARQHSHPGLIGLIDIGTLTLIYALQARLVYAMLYGKKPDPFEAHAARVRRIGLVVKSSVYSCIACAAFVSFNFTLGLLDLPRWEPFVLSVFFVIIALLSLMGMTGPPRSPQGNGLSLGA